MGCRRWFGFEGGVGVLWLVKVGAKVLYRFEKITTLEVVTGNVSLGSLPTINVGQVEGGVVEKFYSPKSANSSA